MRKYYTRPCNFYYGNQARKLINKKNALPLAGNSFIGFDKVEILERKKRRVTKSRFYHLEEIKNIEKNIRNIINNDLKKIVSKRKTNIGLNLDKPKIMGVLNITPDSFSDGGLFYKEHHAYSQVDRMIKDGAVIIDIGGESTRPGSKTVNKKEEWKRIKKTIIKVKKNFKKIFISLDTRKSYVMKQGIRYGVSIINDVSGLNFDKKSFHIINSMKVPFVLHHMQGTPNIMQKNPKYDDVVLDIFDFFEKKINYCRKKRYKKLIILDPGIGFGKNLDHNLRIMSKISLFHSLGLPLLLGTSRKRFIENIVTKFDTKDRTGGTLASVLYGLSQGVQLFRVHNVKEINQGILVFNKILNTN